MLCHVKFKITYAIEVLTFLAHYERSCIILASKVLHKTHIEINAYFMQDF